jgi:hypothetical protein
MQLLHVRNGSPAAKLTPPRRYGVCSALSLKHEDDLLMCERVCVHTLDPKRVDELSCVCHCRWANILNPLLNSLSYILTPLLFLSKSSENPLYGLVLLCTPKHQDRKRMCATRLLPPNPPPQDVMGCALL